MTHGQTQAVSQILLWCSQKLRHYTKKKAHGKNLLRALYQEGITKNIIFLTKEMHSLTLLIPCSLIPSMVENGVKPIVTYAPIMH